MIKPSFSKFVLAVAVVAAPALGQAAVLDLSGLAHGQILNTQVPGVTISAVNDSNGPDIAAIFDTRATNTRDSDLEDPFADGNISGTEIIGNAIIIAENSTDVNNDTILDLPDDEGSRPAGKINFDFDAPLVSLGFDLIDVEDHGAEPFSLTFYDGLGGSAGVDFAALSLRDYPSMSIGAPVFGDNRLNRIKPFSATELGLTQIEMVDFHFGGSGAIANIQYSRVPDAGGSIALLGLALGALGLAKRRVR